MANDKNLPTSPLTQAEATLSLAVIPTRERRGEEDEQNGLHDAFLSMGDALIATDEAGKVILINPKAEQLTGWTREAAVGMDIATVYKVIDEASGEDVQRLLVDIAKGKDVIAVKVDMKLTARDGSHLPIGDSAAPVKNAAGQTTGVVVVFHDNTDQREVRRKVEAFNKRLRQAMAETNHRVKNNLQMIAALVDLQAEEIEGGLSSDATKKLNLHIRTLAQIHDFLTEEAKTSNDITYVSASETLAKLIPMVQKTVVNRLISFTGDTLRLPTNQSSSLALIVNELISNALKHSTGQVAVNLTCENNTANVEVLDDGAGFPEGFDVQKSANNGLHLVAGLTQTDLRGVLECSNRPEGGGRFAITFPISDLTEPAFVQ